MVDHSGCEHAGLTGNVSPRCPVRDEAVENVGPLLEVGGLKPEGSPDFYLCKNCLELWSSLFEESTHVETRKAMDDLLSKLSGTERAVVKLVHGLENGYTNGFDEAVRLLGISPEEVRAIEAGAMTKLRPMPAGLVTVGRDE